MAAITATRGMHAVSVYGVQLVLTPEAAETLLDVTGRIAGDPEKTRRRHMDAIRNALISAEVIGTGCRDIHPLQGCIEFT